MWISIHIKILSFSIHPIILEHAFIISTVIVNDPSIPLNLIINKLCFNDSVSFFKRIQKYHLTDTMSLVIKKLSSISADYLVVQFDKIWGTFIIWGRFIFFKIKWVRFLKIFPGLKGFLEGRILEGLRFVG